MSMVGFPLLLIPLAVYNIIVFLMSGVSFTETLFHLPLLSGAEWPVTLGDLLLTLGIFLLLLELIKGARPGAKYLIDHLLSLIICGGAIAEFLLLSRFANSTFFLLTLLALTEFVSGIALRARRGMPATVSGGQPAPAATQFSHESHAESRARHEPEVVPAAPTATEPAEHHDPIPVILGKEADTPPADVAPHDGRTGESSPRSPETPQ